MKKSLTLILTFLCIMTLSLTALATGTDDPMNAPQAITQPYSGNCGGFTCTYCDAEGNRSAAMDHITFIERGPRHLLREES